MLSFEQLLQGVPSDISRVSEARGESRGRDNISWGREGPGGGGLSLRGCCRGLQSQWVASREEIKGKGVGYRGGGAGKEGGGCDGVAGCLRGYL